MPSSKFTSRISTEHLQIRGTYTCKCAGKLEISEAQPSCWRGALYALNGPIVQKKHYLLSHLYPSMSLLSFLCLGHHLPGTPLSPFTYDNFHEFMGLVITSRILSVFWQILAVKSFQGPGKEVVLRRIHPPLKPGVTNGDCCKGFLHNPEGVVPGDNHYRGKESRFAFWKLLQQKRTYL